MRGPPGEAHCNLRGVWVEIQVTRRQTPMDLYLYQGLSHSMHHFTPLFAA